MFGRRGKVPGITVAEAARRLREGTLVVVDVRERAEVAEVSVPGTLHIPRGQLARRLDELPAGRPLGFLCRSGARSAMATQAALASGLDAVNVEGGVQAWAGAGLPLNTGPEVAT